MSNEKEALKKLYAIAVKQQKILTKLAQAAMPLATTDLATTMNELLAEAKQEAATKGETGVYSAKVVKAEGPLSDGSYDVEMSGSLGVEGMKSWKTKVANQFKIDPVRQLRLVRSSTEGVVRG